MNTAQQLGMPGWMSWLFGHSFVCYLVVGLLFIYGGMVTCRYFLEANAGPLPVWRGQFKSFFPGDALGLIPFLAAVLTLSSTTLSERNGMWQHWAWHFGALVVAVTVVVCLFWFQISPGEVRDGLRWSPTRVWHQIIIWLVGLYFGLALGIPVLFTLGSWPVLRFVAIAGVLVWLAFMVKDGLDALKYEEWDPDHPVHAQFKLRTFG